MAGLWKQIKPARLKDDKMRLALLNAMRKAGTAIKKDFERTTATWEHKPKFEVLVSLTQPGPTVVVDTNDEIYRYVSEGTRPHIIQPKRGKALRFAGTFTAKTLPGVIDARPGGGGGSDTFAAYVFHPGSKPRKFQQLIANQWRRKFKERMTQAMRDAAQASGHGMR